MLFLYSILFFLYYFFVLRHIRKNFKKTIKIIKETINQFFVFKKIVVIFLRKTNKYFDFSRSMISKVYANAPPCAPPCDILSLLSALYLYLSPSDITINNCNKLETIFLKVIAAPREAASKPALFERGQEVQHV